MSVLSALGSFVGSQVLNRIHSPVEQLYSNVPIFRTFKNGYDMYNSFKK